MESAQSVYVSGDYAYVASSTSDSLTIIRNIKGTTIKIDVREAIDILNTQINTSTGIGAEMSIAKKLLADAESAIKGHDYRTADEIAKEGLIEARRISYSHINSKQ